MFLKKTTIFIVIFERRLFIPSNTPVKGFELVPIGCIDISLKSISFNTVDSDLGQFLLNNKGNKFNIIGKLSLNEWKGEKNVEFIIDDISVITKQKN